MNYLIKDASIVNENKIFQNDVLIKEGRIEKIAPNINLKYAIKEVNATGLYMLPGAIDDQVHFREPGLTHKATIYSESRAAVAGGITSFMEMPNTQPPAFTQQLLEDKYNIAKHTSLANYSFFMGTSNNNYDEVMRCNEKRKDICGIKIFMGSSTGNLLVDNPLALDKIFANSELLIATHCEDETIIKENYAKLKAQKGMLIASDHPVIRNEEACFESSFRAIQYAKKYGSRLHILHISTEKELQLFTNLIPLKEKKITAEVCVHHLHFTSDDYERLGNQIKCNPAIKSANNKTALWNALLDNRLDVIATDHAPHTWEEKYLIPDFSASQMLSAEREATGILSPEHKSAYEKAHAGLPLVQHSLMLMLHYYKEGKISLEKITEKMSHAVAACFKIEDRGFIREGYFADIVLIDLNKPFIVKKENILYKCGWSPLENFQFPSSVTHTFINGNLIYACSAKSGENGRFDESAKGMRLRFKR